MYEEKKQVIPDCEESLCLQEFSETERERLLKKIHHYGEFLVVYDGETRIGYAAMYANDLEGYTAYITLIAIKKER